MIYVLYFKKKHNCNAAHSDYCRVSAPLYCLYLLLVFNQFTTYIYLVRQNFLIHMAH